MSKLSTAFMAALLASGALLADVDSNAAQATQDFAIARPGELIWSPVPDGLGAEFAVVRGNPGEAGTYVIRVRFPAGVMDVPHYHSRDRHVTVLEGEWHAGTGSEFDVKRAERLGPGAYMFHPAGALHWDGAAGTRDAVVQIIGQGPVNTVAADPDTPFWVPVR